MTSRVISYIFKGEFNSLRTGLAATGKQTDDAKRKLKELETQAAASQKNLAAFKGGLLNSLGLGAASGPQAIGVAAAAGIGAMVTTTARFEQAQSAVQAATHATAAEMRKYHDAALEAGKATAFTATEATGAIEALAKAGVSTTDILGGGLNGALDLAAAGALNVSDAAEVAATAMTQFGLSGKDVPHIADLLAAGAGKAQGEVSDLGMALNQSGLVAAQMGLSIEETTGTLAAFAHAGLLGSDAGTSLKTMLLRLANPSGEAADTMKRLGINAYDAQGNFVGMKNLAGQLQGAFKGQSQAQRDAAMATIFGSDAIRAANVLYTDGASGIADWTNKVNDSGYAAETAAARMNNLFGDIDKLKGSIETALIDEGEGSQGPLRKATQGATDLIDTYSKIPDSIKNALSPLALLDTASGIKDSLFGDTPKKAKDTADASDKAAEAMRTYTGALNEAGVAADGTSMDLAGLVKSMQEQRKAALGAFDAATQLGQALDDAAAQAKKSNAGISANTKAGRENRAVLSSLAAAWNNQSDAVRNNEGKYRSIRKQFIDTATQMGATREQARRMAKALLDVPDSVAVHFNADTSKANSAIDNINARLNALDGKVAHTYIVTQQSFNEKRSGIPSTQRAGGGYISGPGTSTSDSIPAYLSDGEYVVRAAAVQKYGVAMFDSLNAGHFASGGLAGFAGRGSMARGGDLSSLADFLHGVKLADASLRQLKRAVNASEKALDKEKEKRDDLVSKRSDLASAVAGAFTHDPFGNGAAGLLTQLQADTNDATAAGRGLGTLVGSRGLDAHGALYAALAASGDLNTIQQLSHMSRGQIDRYEAAYNRRASVTAGLGNTVGNAQYGSQIAAQNREIRQLHRVVDKLEQTMKHMGRDVRDGAAKGTADGMRHRDRMTSQRVRGN